MLCSCCDSRETRAHPPGEPKRRKQSELACWQGRDTQAWGWAREDLASRRMGVGDGLGCGLIVGKRMLKPTSRLEPKCEESRWVGRQFIKQPSWRVVCVWLVGWLTTPALAQPYIHTTGELDGDTSEVRSLICECFCGRGVGRGTYEPARWERQPSYVKHVRAGDTACVPKRQMTWVCDIMQGDCG